MGISNAQFAQFLKRQSSRITVLAEIKAAYQTGSGPAEATIYLASGKYRTKPSDSPANQRYRDCLRSSPDFSRGIDEKKLGGRGVVSVGALTLDNADGSLDFLLESIIDGREIRFYAGHESWPRADFRLMNVATVAAVKALNDSELSIVLKDKSFLLDDTVVGDPITSGPNAGKPKPILVGAINNFDITPYLLDSSNLVYHINNFAFPAGWSVGGDLYDVRDSGATLTGGGFNAPAGSLTASAATDTLTRAAHTLAVNDVVVPRRFGPGPFDLPAPLLADTQYWVIASGLTANDFKLSLTKGGAAIDLTTSTVSGEWNFERRRFYVDDAAATLQLSASPSGRITLDILAARDAAGELTTGLAPHTAFKYYLAHYSSLTAAEYDTIAIDALAAVASPRIYYGRAITDRVNLLDLLDEIALGTYSWYGWNAAGVLTVGRLDLPNLDAASSIDSITTDDIEGDLACENLPLPWGKVSLDSEKISTIQTDGLATSVSAASRSLWVRPFSSRAATTDPAGTTYLANWWDYHKSAIDSKPIEAPGNTTPIGTLSPSQAVCDAITEMFAPWTRPYRCTVGIDKYALNPGDCVTLTYPRYGLSSGKKVRVLTIKPRLADRVCDLVLVRKVTPDYSTTAYR